MFIHGFKLLRSCLFFTFLSVGSTQTYAAEGSAIDQLSFDQLVQTSQALTGKDSVKAHTSALWDKYREALKSDGLRFEEHKARRIQQGDKSMRFTVNVKGQAPREGYPLYIALHGGGSAASRLNDSEWNYMSTYYLGGVKDGIMVAPRGVTDTWNLHFVDESYGLYDTLIENMIAFENVDPNRVYLLGFSAGGDGVYQVTPRMPDRFAAANMSAGHHNWIKFDNLFQTPFLLQVGQNDSAYARNTVTVENAMELDRLQALRGGYEHDLFVHYRGTHNSWTDHQNKGLPQTVLAAPIDWLKKGPKQAATAMKDTNAVHWLDRFTRHPHPRELYWNPLTRAPRELGRASGLLADESAKAQLARGRNLFYWLDLSPAHEIPAELTIHASYDPGTNSIALASLGSLDAIRILVHPNMLDLEKPVTVWVEGQSLAPITLKADLKVLTRTLLERGDQNYMFPSEINLVQAPGGGWTLAE